MSSVVTDELNAGRDEAQNLGCRRIIEHEFLQIGKILE